MRYAKQISTGLVLEMQSGGNPDNPQHLQTLLDHCVLEGIPANDIKVGYATEAEADTMRSDKRDADDLAFPLKKWKRTMAQTDSGMPRYLEDHIKDDHDGVAGNEFLQGKYDAKKALRATKP